MSKFAELLYGQPHTVLDILSHEECDEGELRAALTNAFTRIQRIERTLQAKSSEVGLTLEEALPTAGLIVASPDLLDALRTFPGFNASPEEIVEWTQKAVAAENKATGKGGITR